jgi:hypothetical protein
MRRIVRTGEHVHRGDIRRALVEEWPLVQASLSPAAPLLLAWAGLITTAIAIDLGLLICLVGLTAWGLVVARAARLSRRQTALAVGVNLGLGLALVTLKSLLH